MQKGSCQTKESNQKNRLAHLGKVLTIEQKENVIEANRMINASEDVRQKKRESCLAFYKTAEGIALKEKWSSERKGNQHALGYCHTEEAKRSMSLHRMGQQHMLGHHQSDEAKAKVSVATKGENNPMYGRKHQPEVCEKMSAINKERWENMTDEERHNKLVQLGQHIQPTHPELKITSILNNLYPNEWNWVGNKVTVGNSKPDFKHVSRNLLILEHGIYWHLWKPQAEHPEWELTKEKVEQADISFYREQGYDTLIIWEDELMETPEMVRIKIKDFCNKEM